MLATYFGRAPDADLWRRYRAMKAAAALREAMWSMVQEIHSELDFDYRRLYRGLPCTPTARPLPHSGRCP